MKKINYEVANSDQFRSQADKNKITIKNMTKKERIKHFWFDCVYLTAVCCKSRTGYFYNSNGSEKCSADR